MSSNVPIADSLPSSPVALPLSRITIIFFIAPSFLLGIVSQNLPSTNSGQPGWEQGRLGFQGKASPPFGRKEKPLGCPKRLFFTKSGFILLSQNIGITSPVFAETWYQLKVAVWVG